MTRATVPAAPETIRVPCCDLNGRGRSLSITPLVGGDILLVIPPGEIARLNILQAHQFRERLRRAVFQSLCLSSNELSCTTSCTITGAAAVVRSAVPCVDTLGREFDLTVVSQFGEPITILSPPGEHALLKPLEVGRLRGAMATAIDISSARRVRVTPAASPSPDLLAAG
ncbi:hypothetical protein M8C13_08790 [Crossiella sp. SN42]|uniref:hypothetical protein n=1 Tax=Crossiella sp. SN42 TaxID=2944808 RepID=UPI00207C345E|nr:hypothetical protein [Crossiella sp. SN42]MCO1575852.1 hypothetical protein [Crossiella sp. SN42]